MLRTPFDFGHLLQQSPVISPIIDAVINPIIEAVIRAVLRAVIRAAIGATNVANCKNLMRGTKEDTVSNWIIRSLIMHCNTSKQSRALHNLSAKAQ